MTKQDVIGRLADLPERIQQAEYALLEAGETVQSARQTLTDKEGELLTSGQIDGKNAETRNAQIRQLTATQRQYVADAEKQQQEARILLNRALNEFSAARAIARILGTEVA